MSETVCGKSALITGAGSGISLAFARLLLSQGCNVVIADLNLRPEADEVVQLYSNSPRGTAANTKPRALFHRTDVSSWADLLRAFNTAKEIFGKVDIVCAGAGVFEPPWSSFWNPPGSDESVVDSVAGDRFRTIDINLVHPIMLTQIVIMDHLREMKTTGTRSSMRSKTIIHISSVNGQVTPLWTPLYNASKHGINGFVRSLAPLEKRLGIRVAAVAPGLVKTPMWSENKEKQGPMSKDVEWVLPEEVADLMLSIIETDNIHSLFREPTAQVPDIQIAGGSILEISGNRIRDVQAFLDPGPQGISSQHFDFSKMEEGVFQGLEQRVLARL